MVERVNSSMIYLVYCMNFCKCHNVPPHTSTTIKKILVEAVSEEHETEEIEKVNVDSWFQ
jgi:hypothetical protein